MTPLEMTASKLASSNGQLLDVGLDELDLGVLGAVAQPRGLVELLVGDVDAHDPAARANEDRGAEDVGAGARAKVEDHLARPQRGEVEVMADAGEGGERLGRDRVEERGGVAEVRGELAAHLEMELGIVPPGDVAVHVLDRRLEQLAVHERARIELRQGLGLGHLVGDGAGCGGAHRDLLRGNARTAMLASARPPH